MGGATLETRQGNRPRAWEAGTIPSHLHARMSPASILYCNRPPVTGRCSRFGRRAHMRPSGQRNALRHQSRGARTAASFRTITSGRARRRARRTGPPRRIPASSTPEARRDASVSSARPRDASSCKAAEMQARRIPRIHRECARRGRGRDALCRLNKYLALLQSQSLPRERVD